jgi:hypothetical protein
MNEFPNVFIGWDQREQKAYDVLVESILDYCTIPINIIPIKEGQMRAINFYRRHYTVTNGQKKDVLDGRPFSTDFSFTRFLVPFLSRHSGYSIFMDCDMLVRSDIAAVFDYPDSSDFSMNTERKAIYCVHHNYNPDDTKKMDNQEQVKYSKKNWSSFMLWDCSHPAHKTLTLDDINTKDGWWLHNFQWLKDEQIGMLPEEWNWLDGHSPDYIEAKNVHFTRGGPWFEGWKPKQISDAKYALEWQQLSDQISVEESLGKERKIKWEKTYVR